MTKLTEDKNLIKVFVSKFHAIYDGETLYEGKSLKQAVKIARKNDCNSCGCGGPRIVEFYNEGTEGSEYYEWHATAPFKPASKPFWA